ncbi:TetR/AcrR family transcriptional regulator [Levilactobacillus zymae]|uniref:TetR/AcrR family transcriptional regulator n=1 Tax=Levilactobacillus zymae TaxID=267363 RepID=UPI0028B63DF7|nr:TetR/AcrR family transcriptional regulator [Levilactobacillus zymae]MDT6979659.1 TetR/AcrR family transcriptional regulator [Levilactobacillus zymae]
MEKQQQLLTAAYHLFKTKGFKATSIAEIAAAAQVAVGTFYNFYDSKAAIFLQIYTAENERVKANIIAAVDLDADPLPLVRQVVHEIMVQSQDNLILQEWFKNPKLNALIAQTAPSAVEDSLVYTTFVRLLDRWQARGLLAPGMTQARGLNLFNALIVVDFHQSEVTTTDYAQVLDDLITGMLAVILK